MDLFILEAICRYFRTIFLAILLEWVAIPFSRYSWPRGWTHISCIAGKFLTAWATRETLAMKDDAKLF